MIYPPTRRHDQEPDLSEQINDAVEETKEFIKELKEAVPDSADYKKIVSAIVSELVESI